MKEYPIKIGNREFIVQVGQNKKENWELIDYADGFDLWFHLNDKPSGHVVIKEILNIKITHNEKITYNEKEHYGYPFELILIASQYCKSQSKYKNTKVSVVYTTINNIRKGKDIGSVFIKNSQYVIL
jgi:predicted ribosome quality control (RQC) complex YloA/Tae2 family protein